MKKRIYIIWLATLVSVLGSEVRIIEIVEEPAVGTLKRTYVVQNAGLVENRISYNQRTDPETGKVFIGDVTARSTGIGMSRAWYYSGFLQILINKVPVMAPATININGNTLFFHFEEKNVDVQLSLAFQKTSSIIGEVSIVSQEPIKSLDIRFMATPGHSYFDNRHTFDRWASTAKRNLHLVLKEEVALKPSEEFWVMMYDGKYNAQRGFAALLVDPEKTESVDVTGRGNSVAIDYIPKSMSENVRFMLWAIPESYMDAETLYEHLKETATKNLDALRAHESPTNK